MTAAGEWKPTDEMVKAMQPNLINDYEDCIAALIAVQPLIAAEEREKFAAQLQDPIAVHLNMLRGVIAKPTVKQILHLYGKDAFQSIAAQERERIAHFVETLPDNDVETLPEIDMATVAAAIRSLIPNPPSKETDWGPPQGKEQI